MSEKEKQKEKNISETAARIKQNLSDMWQVTKQQVRESLGSVAPVFIIVLFLSLILVPVPSGTLLCFIAGTVMLIVGSGLFNIGAEYAMTPIGEKVGAAITKSRSLLLIIVAGFFLGVAVTVAEPDLQVLATQIPSIPEMLLIYGVAAGVGLFLVIALLRMLFRIPLNFLLVGLYAVVIILSFFVPQGYQAISFDAGGVTTGPMTVPFIMALGVGVASIRNDKNAEDDSFGLVALCSVGPILAVMILGLLPQTDAIPRLAGAASEQLVKTAATEVNAAPVVPDVGTSLELARLYLESFPYYLKEMLKSLLPIVGAFLIFRIISLRLKVTMFIKIVRGLVYTYVGLVIFMTGVNLGFLPMGYYLGELMSNGITRYLLIPTAMIMGYASVKAEPAVAVLNKQVEHITDGAVSAELMGSSLSIGVAISLGLSMIRVITGISILWFIIPGYLIAIILSFFVPKLYTAIAFDSGGVASGPMTAAFLLPFAQGSCHQLGGNVATDAFGVVAMVAMTPIITIQLLSVVKKKKPQPVEQEVAVQGAELDDQLIIRL